MAKRDIAKFTRDMTALSLPQLVEQYRNLQEDWQHYLETDSLRYARDLLYLMESYGNLRFGFEFADAIAALVG